MSVGVLVLRAKSLLSFRPHPRMLGFMLSGVVFLCCVGHATTAASSAGEPTSQQFSLQSIDAALSSIDRLLDKETAVALSLNGRDGGHAGMRLQSLVGFPPLVGSKVGPRLARFFASQQCGEGGAGIRRAAATPVRFAAARASARMRKGGISGAGNGRAEKAAKAEEAYSIEDEYDAMPKQQQQARMEKEHQAKLKAPKKSTCGCDFPAVPESCPADCKEEYDLLAKAYCAFNKCKGKNGKGNCGEAVILEKREASERVTATCQEYPRCINALEELMFAPPMLQDDAGVQVQGKGKGKGEGGDGIPYAAAAGGKSGGEAAKMPAECTPGPQFDCCNKGVAKECTAAQMAGKTDLRKCTMSIILQCRGFKIDPADKGGQAEALAETVGAPGNGFSVLKLTRVKGKGKGTTDVQIKYTPKEMGEHVVCLGTVDPRAAALNDAVALWDVAKATPAMRHEVKAMKGGVFLFKKLKPATYIFACATSKSNAAATMKDPDRSSTIEMPEPQQIKVTPPKGPEAQGVIPMAPRVQDVIDGRRRLLTFLQTELEDPDDNR